MYEFWEIKVNGSHGKHKFVARDWGLGAQSDW